MSLINDMLKDLERNRRNQTPSESIMYGLRFSEDRDRSHLVVWIVLGVLLIGCGVFIGYWLLMFHREIQTPLDVSAIQISTPHKKAPSVQAVVSPKKKHEQESTVAHIAAPSAPKISLASSIPSFQMSMTQEQKIASQVEKALDHLENGNTETAIALLKTILGDNPKALKPREILIQIFLKNGHFQQASALIEEGLKFERSHPNYLLFKAEMLNEAHHEMEALNVLMGAQPLIQDNLDYYALEASLSEKLAHYQKASEIYQSLIAAEPQNALWWMGYGFSQSNLNHFAQAVQAFKQALTLGTLPEGLIPYVQEQLRQFEG